MSPKKNLIAKKVLLTAIQSAMLALLLSAMSSCYRPGGAAIQNLGHGWIVYADTLDTIYQVNLPNSVFQLLHDDKLAPHYHDFNVENTLAPLSQKSWT